MTVRNRLVLSYLAMLFVPFFLIVLMSGLLRAILDPDFGRYDKSGRSHNASWYSYGQLDPVQVSMLSLALARNPLLFDDPAAASRFDRELGWPGVLVVLRDRELVYASPSADWPKVKLAFERSGVALPAEISSAVPPLPARDGMRKTGHPEHWIQLAQVWNYAAADRGLSTLYFITDYQALRSEWLLPGLVYVLAAMAVLFLVNGSLTYLTARGMTRPLKRLEQMARRVADGDLTPLAMETQTRSGKTPDEFGAVLAAFEEMRSRLKASLDERLGQEEARRQLIAAISHDLRTPLAVIKGYTEGLRDGVAQTEQKRAAYLATILAKTGTLEKLIADLFLFSRLEMKDFPYERRCLNLSQFLRECLDELSADLPLLSIQFGRQDESLLVSIDPDRVKRVVANLAQNAAVYAGRNDPELQVRTSLSGGQARIEFEDNGPGLSAELRTKVFERFYRGDPSRGSAGAGLGLAIARLIVEAQGGRIFADTNPGGGALFVVELPLASGDGRAG